MFCNGYHCAYAVNTTVGHVITDNVYSMKASSTYRPTSSFCLSSSRWSATPCIFYDYRQCNASLHSSIFHGSCRTPFRPISAIASEAFQRCVKGNQVIRIAVVPHSQIVIVLRKELAYFRRIERVSSVSNTAFQFSCEATPPCAIHIRCQTSGRPQ
jgi:hypothetical protein